MTEPNESMNGSALDRDQKTASPRGERAAETPKRGFGTLPPEKRSAISALGGRAAHAAGTAYKFNSESGRIAGRKGGLVALAKSKEARLQYEQENALAPDAPATAASPAETEDEVSSTS